MPLKLLFKVTSRSRPERCIKTLDSIVNNIANKDDYSIQCTFDSDDNTTNNQAFIDKLHTYKRLTYYFGNSLNKIDAINKNIEKFPSAWDIILNVSDDQRFTEFGFDDIVRKAMEQYYPDTDGCLHFPDTKQGQNLITLSILGRKYFERFGFIYHPDYISLWSDNETTTVAKILNKYTFIINNIFIHEHPAFGMVPTDDQYIKTESYFMQDKATYERRLRQNFDL